MAKAFQFAFLLERAVDKREEAVRLLSLAMQRVAMTQERLQQIQQYREEYRQRLTDTASRGMHIHRWRDFQLFLGKLDTAVDQQQAELQRAESQLELAKQGWRECEREVKAYETLRVRHAEGESRKEARREQGLSDEWASNIHRRGKT